MVRGDRDGAVIVGRIAGPHVDRVEGRAAGQRLADDRQFEHRLAARIAADEAVQAAVGAGEVGIDGIDSIGWTSRFTGLPLMLSSPFLSAIVSPGRPITRLI